MRWGLVIAVLALVVTGCGSAEPAMSPRELFMAYARSADVENDRFPPAGGGDDRLANFAAFLGGPEQVQSALLRAFPCDEAGGDFPVSECDPNAAVRAAAREAGGELYGRSLVVRHADGSLELLTLYVIHGEDVSLLVDRSGRTYTDLADFRANNDLLTAEDTVLTPREITSVPGEGEIVTVTGHSPPTWPWWLLGGAGALVVLGAVVLVLRRRSNARFDAALDPYRPDRPDPNG